jgi:GNAT superfamily N-acetyltransferase
VANLDFSGANGEVERTFLLDSASSRTMQIVRAKPEDAKALTHIAVTAKRHWHYPKRWMESWRELLPIRPEFIAAHDTYVAVAEGRRVGFYGLSSADGKLRLDHLWVLPDAMGGGVGRLLFTHALERVRALGFQSLEIESDPNAEGFYQRMGARRVGTRITELEGQRRELPVLIYKFDYVA